MSLLEQMLQSDPNIDMTKLYGHNVENPEGVKAMQEVFSLIANATNNPTKENLQKLDDLNQ